MLFIIQFFHMLFIFHVQMFLMFFVESDGDVAFIEGRAVYICARRA